MKFQRKQVVVDAFQWTPGMELPFKPTTDNPDYVMLKNKFGPQVAKSGDYILTYENGDVKMMKKKEFEEDFEKL